MRRLVDASAATCLSMNRFKVGKLDCSGLHWGRNSIHSMFPWRGFSLPVDLFPGYDGRRQLQQKNVTGAV